MSGGPCASRRTVRMNCLVQFPDCIGVGIRDGLPDASVASMCRALRQSDRTSGHVQPAGTLLRANKTPLTPKEEHGLAASLIGSHSTNSPTRNFRFGAEPVL